MVVQFSQVRLDSRFHRGPLRGRESCAQLLELVDDVGVSIPPGKLQPRGALDNVRSWLAPLSKNRPKCVVRLQDAPDAASR